MKTVKGWQFPDADEQMARELTEAGTYQAGNLDMALRFVTNWTAALDGGAHVGTWTKPLAARFGRVLAVEPAPDTFEALEANVAAFGLTNVDTLNAALGAVPGSVSMRLDSIHEAAKNTGARFVGGPGAIPQVTIDSMSIQTLGLLKLDVEGAEPLALLGARATIERCRPVIIYENKGLWSRFGLKPDAVTTLLSKAGYRRLASVVRDDIWGPAA